MCIRDRQVANGRLFWGQVDGIGYLNVVTMGAFDADAAPDDVTALEAARDEALGAFQGARAVIVDVSNNRGGYDSVSLRLAGRFASERRLAYTKVGFGARDVAPQAFHVEPSPRVRYLGPVYLLTSDVTVSAGEVFTLALRALPNVRHVGTTCLLYTSDAADE